MVGLFVAQARITTAFLTLHRSDEPIATGYWGY
jgi:hypothetical protein